MYLVFNGPWAYFTLFFGFLYYLFVIAYLGYNFLQAKLAKKNDAKMWKPQNLRYIYSEDKKLSQDQTEHKKQNGQ